MISGEAYTSSNTPASKQIAVFHTRTSGPELVTTGAARVHSPRPKRRYASSRPYVAKQSEVSVAREVHSHGLYANVKRVAGRGGHLYLSSDHSRGCDGSITTVR